MKQSLRILAMAALVLLLCGCESIPLFTEPTTEPPVEQIALVVTQDELAALDEYYPALREADFRGSTCYEALESYAAAHPQIDVLYTVSLGNIDVSPAVTALSLSPEDYSYPALRRNLMYLRELESVFLSDCSLPAEALHELRELYPEIRFKCEINFLGNRCDDSTTSLDLSAFAPDEVLSQAALLEMFPNLKEIELMTAEGTTQFTLEDAAALQQYVPNTLLRFSFTLFEKQISTTDEEITYVGKKVGNKEGSLETLRMALSVLRGCKRLVLDNCYFDNDDLAAVRDEFRDTTKVVWRIWFGDGGILTDRTMIRHVYGLYDYNSANLIYCEDAQFVDFGHNEVLKHCDFVSGMKNLRAIILSGSMISDLSPFAYCENLEFLEIAYCGYVTDITPLAYCKNLKRLNIAYTKVADLSPLDELELDVMVDARSQTDAEERARFDDLHPDCIVQHSGDAKDDQPYGYPWRYEENGDPNEYYALLKEQFHYPNPKNTTY